ncbi:MAG TPA: helix-turn-helix domain-containing protein [Anaeromyxobacter sp.]|nr:helix-turn-helix domain-containing protein [Anaeromyxobacter sp.]
MSTIPTDPEPRFSLGLRSPVQSENAGLFISRGVGRHPDRVIESHEIIHVVRGTLALCEEGREYTVTAGDYLILVPGVRHWAPEDYRPGLEFYWIHFRRCASDDGARGRDTIDIPRLGRVGDPERLEELFRWFLDAQEQQDLDETLANGLCHMMLLVLAHRPRRAADEDDRIPMLAREAKRLLSRSFQEDVTTSLLARKLTCNPDYLGRLYKRTFGLSIMDDLHVLRIRLAKTLLMEEELNVNEVATRCGYNDSTYFRRMFRRLAGMAPSRFRDLYSHMHINSV